MGSEVNSNESVYVLSSDGPMLWGELQQKSFLDELIHARTYIDFDDNVSVQQVIRVITTVMTSTYRHRYTTTFFETQFVVLHERYELFKYVKTLPLVVWNQWTNEMNIPFYTKLALQYISSKTQQYFVYGEPIWDDLCFMFDDPNEWEDDPRLVSPAEGMVFFEISNSFPLSEEPLLCIMREREYKKIYNARWSRDF